MSEADPAKGRETVHSHCFGSPRRQSRLQAPDSCRAARSRPVFGHRGRRAFHPAGPPYTHTQRHHPRCRTRMPVRQWSVCLPQSRRYPSTSDLPVESPSPTRRSLCDSGPTVGPHARSAIEFAGNPSSFLSLLSLLVAPPPRPRPASLVPRAGMRAVAGRRGVTAKGRSETPRRARSSGSPFVRVASGLAPPAGGSESRRGSPRPARQLAQLEGQSVCRTCSKVAVPHHPVFGKVGLDFGKVGLA